LSRMRYRGRRRGREKCAHLHQSKIGKHGVEKKKGTEVSGKMPKTQGKNKFTENGGSKQIS